MNNNWKNHYLDNAIHHVTGTVNAWQKILLYPEILSILFLDFNRMTVRWNVTVWAFVIMPEHFHMLIQSCEGENIKRFIHGGRRSISGRVKKFIESNNRSFADYCVKSGINTAIFYIKTAGKSSFRFWKEKPRVFPISNEIEVQKKLDYIHNNPVRRGLVTSPEEWEYSSFNYYTDGEIVGLPVGGGVRMSLSFHPDG